MNERECRIIVSERSHGFCEVRLEGEAAFQCRGQAQSMHHRRKRSQGGQWQPSNILHVCGDGTSGCHGYMEANPATARRYRLWLFAGMEPLATPARITFRGYRGWYLLDDEGSLTWLSTAGQVRLLGV